VEGNEHFEFFTFPHSPLALTRTNNRVDGLPAPPGRAREWAEDVLFGNHVFGALCRLGRLRPAQIPRINRLVSRVAGSQTRVDRLGGRPHWGKRHFQPAATLRDRYPEWDRFAAVRARLDPAGRFANEHVDRVLGPVGVPASPATS